MLVPSCCSSRATVQSTDIRKASTFMQGLPEFCINKETHMDEDDSTSPSSKITFNENEESKNLSSPKKANWLRDISESRRSTNHTINSVDISALTLGKDYSEQLTCMCNKKAEGYCPLCPNARYCEECFEKKHQFSMKLHNFIRYSIKKVKHSEVSHMTKIKTLMWII